MRHFAARAFGLHTVSEFRGGRRRHSSRTRASTGHAQIDETLRRLVHSRRTRLTLQARRPKIKLGVCRGTSTTRLSRFALWTNQRQDPQYRDRTNREVISRSVGNLSDDGRIYRSTCGAAPSSDGRPSLRRMCDGSLQRAISFRRKTRFVLNLGGSPSGMQSRWSTRATLTHHAAKSIATAALASGSLCADYECTTGQRRI